MPRELFRAPVGVEIESEDLTSGINILQGAGAPGSGSPIPSLHQNAPIGSIYFQSDAASEDLNVWWKFQDVNNDVTDWQVGASKEYVDNLFGSTSTGTAPVSTLTVLDNTLLVGVATEVKWMLQIKDAGGDRQAFEVHALTDGTTVSFTTYALLKVGVIGGNIGFDVNVSGSPNVWEVSLNPNVGAGTLTYTLTRIAFSYLA